MTGKNTQYAVQVDAIDFSFRDTRISENGAVLFTTALSHVGSSNSSYTNVELKQNHQLILDRSLNGVLLGFLGGRFVTWKKRKKEKKRILLASYLN